MSENKFEFTYTAPTESERRAIESIKSQYVEKRPMDGAYERILKLDKRVKSTPMAVALSVGIIGTLIFGLGLAMVLEWNLILWGVIVALVGAIPIALAPFLHKILLKRGKSKYGDEIIRLSEEILNK